jgi:hypothetical protein
LQGKNYKFFSWDLASLDREQHPETTQMELMALIGQLWDDSTLEDKQRYQQLADEDTQRFERQKCEFQSRGTFYTEDGMAVGPFLPSIRSRRKKRVKTSNLADM